MGQDVQNIVIVGGGLAAAKAAEAVRDDGFDGRVVLLAEEAERPYERPALSKGHLLGDTTRDDVYVHPADYYHERDIELHLADPVTRIDRDAGAVLTDAGRRVPFDRLLLATGAAPRRGPFPVDALDGVVLLRTLQDSVDLADRLRAVEHVTVIGAGWIGCEVAAAARTLGTQVTMVDPLDVPLARVVGTEVGQIFADLHVAHGVDLRMGVSVSGVHGRHTAEHVTLSDGTTVDTQLIVVGIGATPRTELADAAGLQVDDGILVDQTLTTSDPRILAAGDVARAWNPRIGQQLRVEHWANALHQGSTAGRNLLGAGAAYDRLPYFFSDQYDLGMEHSGHAGEGDQVIFRGSRGAGELLVFWSRDGRVTAGMTINVWGVTEDIQRLLSSADRVDPAALADPDVPLADLAASTAPRRRQTT